MESIRADLNLNDVFTKKILLIGIGFYLLIVSLVLLFGFIITIKTYSDIYHTYEDAIRDNKFRYSSKLETCYILDCIKYKTIGPTGKLEYIIVDKNGPYFTNKNRFKERNIIFDNITVDLNIRVNGNDTVYYINNKYIKKGLYKSFMVVTPIILIAFSLIYVPFYLRYIKRKLIEKGEYKSELESNLARDLTEMLHHELGAPLGIIKTQTDELLFNIYPKYFTQIKNGNTLDGMNLTSEKDLLNVELFRSLYLGIARIDSVLTLIAGAKHIRFSNGTVPIIDIITNIASSVNSFKLSKILVRCHNDKLFKKYSVTHEYGNGNMLNALHVIFNNAIEALAEKIELTPRIITGNNTELMEIFIKDNGTGVLDKHGNPDLSGNIFKYGYTSKGKDTSEKLIVRLLKLIGFNLVENKGPKRGIGLYITKQLLKNVGGDLELVDTSKDGTTFKLTVPVKKTIFT